MTKNQDIKCICGVICVSVCLWHMTWPGTEADVCSGPWTGRHRQSIWCHPRSGYRHWGSVLRTVPGRNPGTWRICRGSCNRSEELAWACRRWVNFSMWNVSLVSERFFSEADLLFLQSVESNWEFKTETENSSKITKTSCIVRSNNVIARHNCQPQW